MNPIMKKYVSVLLSTLAMVAGSHALAQTASFDCNKAHTPIEVTICRTSSLGAQDVRMATYYQVLLDAPAVSEGMAYREFRDTLRDGQANWQRQTRDKCGEQTACLTRAYQQRIGTLQELARRMLRVSFDGGATSGNASNDAGNATYMFEGNSVTLNGGSSERPVAPGSAAMHLTKLVGPAADGKLDGRPGSAVFLSDSPGGSGTFLYVAFAFEDGHGTNAVLLGDRVEPQSIAVDGAAIVVTYLDRPQQAPMYVKPSVKIVRRIPVVNGRLIDKS
jgi:uncharacterized protein